MDRPLIALRRTKLYLSGAFDHGQQCHRAMLDRHFDADAGADLAVVNLERTDLGSTLGDFDMPRAVMDHEDDIRIEIHGIIFGE